MIQTAGRNTRRAWTGLAGIALAFVTVTTAAAQQALEYYELRTYSASPGKMDTMLGEFRSWILPGVLKVGMHPVGFWTAEGVGDGQVIYLMAYVDRAERDAAWARFRADPEIERARQAAAAKVTDGVRAIAKVESVFMTMTDFSPHPSAANGAVLR